MASNVEGNGGILIAAVSIPNVNPSYCAIVHIYICTKD